MLFFFLSYSFRAAELHFPCSEQLFIIRLAGTVEVNMLQEAQVVLFISKAEHVDLMLGTPALFQETKKWGRAF